MEGILHQLMHKMDQMKKVVNSLVAQSICLQQVIAHLQYIPATPGHLLGASFSQGKQCVLFEGHAESSTRSGALHGADVPPIIVQMPPLRAQLY